MATASTAPVTVLTALIALRILIYFLFVFHIISV
jgi:hypothetical protein